MGGGGGGRGKNEPIHSQDYENLECNRSNNDRVIYTLNRLRCKNARFHQFFDSIEFLY